MYTVLCTVQYIPVFTFSGWLAVDQCYWIVDIDIVDPEWFIPDQDPSKIFQSSGSSPYYLSKFGNKKTTLNSIKKKTLLNICHFLFQTTVQSYSTHSP